MQAVNPVHIEVEKQDMYEAMRAQAQKYISELFINMPEEGLSRHDDLAKSIKEEMDRRFSPSWHCVVGKGFSSAVTYKNRHFLFIYIMNKAIMIFKH